MKNIAGLLIASWILVAGGIWGCGGNEDLSGRYRAESRGEDPPQTVTLELNENGQGTWKISGDQVTFKWEVRGREIRLHTREGGVATGLREGKAIHLQMPGMPPLTFQRQAR